jgi:hypothetical protein
LLCSRCERQSSDCSSNYFDEIAASHCLPQGSGPQANCIDDYSRDLRLTKWGSGAVCTAGILSRSCPLWVISGHCRRTSECPLYSRKRTSTGAVAMSAKCH